MRKNNHSAKEPIKSLAEDKEFLEKNRRELQKALTDLCKKYDLPFEPPFSHEEADQILKVAREGELGKLLETFPQYLTFNGSEKINARLIVKFNLDPKLSLQNLGKIIEAISKKLDSSHSSEANPELYRFRKDK